MTKVDIDNENVQELLAHIIHDGPKYCQLVLSEAKAFEILDEVNKPFYYRNEDFKSRYDNLLSIANSMGLDLIMYEYDENPYAFKAEITKNGEKELLFEGHVTYKDIIDRLEENCFEEVNIIDEHAYMYMGYCGFGLWSEEKSATIEATGAEIMQGETYDFYSDLIYQVTKQYRDNEKNLKKQKER